MKHTPTRVTAVLLSVVLLLSMMPFTAFAANNYDESVDSYYSVVSKQDWDLSPGVSESEIVVDNATGSRRQVLHVVEADVNNPYASVMTSYTNLQPETYITPDMYDVSGMSKHAADIEQNFGYNVVAGMNCCLSWYNSQAYINDPTRVNEPLGVMVVDGYTVFDHSVGFPTCLVINKDERPEGMEKVEMRNINSSEDLTGYEEQVIPTSSGFILKDGVVQGTENHTDAASRSVVGVKADGTVVFVMNEGRDAPTSVGMSTYELGMMMKSLGCVDAVNCDGGGSSTFLSERPGESLKVNGKLSEGAERPNASGIMVISSAPASGEFEVAHITADNDIVTPNSTVQFTAIGTDLVGTEVDIPAEAEWALADASFGTIDQNGLFTSNGTTGDVTAQLIYNNEVVGTAAITVALPDSISFAMENITVPFGKTVNLDVTAKLGAKFVTLKPSDISFSLSDNAIGTIDGLTFTAPAESEVTSAIITATIVGTDVSATANINLGRGSVVALDFEDGNTSLFTCADMHGYHNQCSTYLVDSTTGKVHSGNYAQAMHVDFSETCDWGGVQGVNFYYRGEELDHTGATTIGFWMYIPEEAVGIYPAYRASVTDVNGSNVTFMPDAQTKGFAGSCVEESGWQYVSIDMTSFAGDTIKNRTGYAMFQFYLQYVFDKPFDKSINTDVTFYIDDITIDYSSAVDDREEPIFGTVNCVANDVSGTTVAMARYNTPSIDAGTVSFTAAVAEDTTKSNYTGLNTQSAKAYVDGVEVNCSFVGGSIYTDNINLAAGVHTVKFSICDAMGNKAVVVRHININANNNASTINVVPRDTSITKALCGSLYYLDVVATDAETIQSADLVIDLNNVNDWELQGIEVADGFTATYDMDEIEHTATINIERTGASAATGEAVLASLPIRVWGSEGWTYGNKTAVADGSKTWTPVNAWSTKTLWPMDIKVDVDYGKITYVDGYTATTTGTFSGDQIVTDTEVYYSRLTSAGSTGIALFDSADWSSKTRWHEHNAVPVEDKAATCTEEGYSGRTFCEACNSVVDWGTTVPATGHSYSYVDGQFVCEDCGDVYEIGTGLFEINGSLYYAINGNLMSGWQNYAGDMYYFDETDFTAVNGAQTINKHNYVFEDCKLVKGSLENDGNGNIRYYFADRLTTNGWTVIDGDTYFFEGTGLAKTGVSKVTGFAITPAYYLFSADGVLSDESGLYTDADGNIRFLENGKLIAKGLVQDTDGAYYYIAGDYKALKDSTYGVSEAKANGLLPEGTYTFGADGKMVVDEPEEPEIQGLVIDTDGEVRYYVNGVATYAGLVQDGDGNYYYINSGKKAVKNCNYGVTKTNGLLPEGLYTFGADGKMVVDEPDEEPVVQGLVVDTDGEVRYYVNGVATYAGLVQDGDGNYYYINSGKKAVKNCRYGVTKTNGLLPEGSYTFGADGKMVIVQPEPEKQGLVIDTDDEVRYYVNGVATYAGLVQDGDGNYYYINSGKKAVKNCRYGVTKTNGLLPEGLYTFGEDGKMVIA